MNYIRLCITKLIYFFFSVSNRYTNLTAAPHWESTNPPATYPGEGCYLLKTPPVQQQLPDCLQDAAASTAFCFRCLPSQPIITLQTDNSKPCFAMPDHFLMLPQDPEDIFYTCTSLWFDLMELLCGTNTPVSPCLFRGHCCSSVFLLILSFHASIKNM